MENENLYSQWMNGKKLNLDPDLLRKFKLRRAIGYNNFGYIKYNLRDPDEIIDTHFERRCLFLIRDPENVKFLLDQGANPNLLTKEVILNDGTLIKSESCLYRAINTGAYIKAKLLLDYVILI